MKRSIQALIATGRSLDAIGHQLERAARMVMDPRWDLVLLCVDGAPPGLTAAALEQRNVKLLSLPGIADELRASWWPVVRVAARLRRGRRIPRGLYRRAARLRTASAIFVSQGWRDEAVGAGFDPAGAVVIPFGIAIPPRPTGRAPTGKLLWVGRLSHEKGLHYILEALPGILARNPDVRLTAIAGQGPVAYRQLIEATIARLGLTSVVDLRPPVARGELDALYRSHDVLCFCSAFRDPVALVLMEAYASGIPVAANGPTRDAALVRDGETCLCWEPTRPDTLAMVVSRLLGDEALRLGLVERARGLVLSRYTLDAMGRAFDRELRASLPGTNGLLSNAAPSSVSRGLRR